MLSRSPIQFDLWKQLWGKDTLPEESKSRKGHIGPRWAASQRKRAGRILSQDTSRALLKLQISNHTLSILKNSKSSSVLPSCFLFDHASFHVIFQENCGLQNQSNTPPIPNIVPENQWLEYSKKNFLEVIRQFSVGSCQLNFHFPPFPDSAPVRHQAIHESYRTGPRNVVLGKGPVAFSFGKKMHLLSNWVPFPPQFFGVNIQKYVKPTT